MGMIKLYCIPELPTRILRVPSPNVYTQNWNFAIFNPPTMRQTDETV